MKFHTTFLFGFILSTGLLFSITSWSQSADSVAYNIQADEEEYEILKSLYEKAGGSRWKNNTNWLNGKTHADFATWHGITVEHGDVVAIDLRDNGLKGELPDRVYKLVRLRQVSIESNNALRGERGRALGIAKRSDQQAADEFRYTKPQYGFIENKGQIRDQDNNPQSEVKFLLPLPNNNVVLRSAGFSYDTHIIEEKERTNRPGPLAGSKFEDDEMKDITYKFHRVDIELVEANPNPEIITSEQSTDYLIYHTGAQGSSQMVYHYGKVLYKNIYPNIDLEFVARPGETKPIEYSFYVHPGGDFKQIKLKYKGATRGELVNGKVELTLAHGKLTENIPASFMQRSRANVDIRYKRIGDSSNELMVGFEGDVNLGEETLIIDPIPSIEWGTYFGGSGIENGYSIDYSSSGVCITGYTNSGNLIATSNTYQTTYGNNGDAFVAKFSVTGDRIWATYFGGNQSDEGRGLKIGVNNDIYVTGLSYSTNLVFPGAHQSNKQGFSDAFLAKFSSSGSLIWATFFGGDGVDYGNALILDLSDNIYLSGGTGSSGMATTGTHQSILKGSEDAFIAKFSSNGILVWSTYFGGNNIDQAADIAIDNNSIYVTGRTESYSDISSIGSHQTNFGEGQRDAFLAKFSTITGTIIWSTYYGGGNEDFGWGVSVDSNSNVILVGRTNSSNNISTPNSFLATYQNEGDAFIAKFNSYGVRIWGTYFGESQFDSGQAVATGSNGEIYLVGHSRSNGLTTVDAHQSTNNGDLDIIIVKFLSSGQLEWSSYYGGQSFDTGLSLAYDNGTGTLFLTGYTASGSSIATSGIHQVNLQGFRDAYVAKFNVSNLENVCSSDLHSGLNLPQWVLGSTNAKAKRVDWRTSTPTVTEAVNSTIVASTNRATSVGIDGCGQLAFYVMHSGTDVAYQLHIHAPDGTQLTNTTAGSPLRALNSATHNVEAQVVLVPGKSDEWYIIYSRYQSPCSLSSSAYCPAYVLYARVKYVTATQTLTILERDVELNASTTFVHGKAVSQHVNGDYSKHYLYLAQRASSSNTTRFFRYKIEGSGITYDAQIPNNITAQWWPYTIQGSTLELSADGNFLAMLNKNENTNATDIIIYDTREFTNAGYSPVIIKVPQLMVVPDDVNLTQKTMMSTLALSGAAFTCLKNAKNKLMGLQFSPNGQYLYVTGGGFQLGYDGYSHETVLLQIDLATGTGTGDFDVRMQRQQGVGINSTCAGSSNTSNNNHHIRFIESAYDGRIYFSKNNSTHLFVIPNPDCPMPQRLLPGEVDLSTPEVPNLYVGSNGVYMPETIDGYNYRQSGNGQIADLAITTEQYLCAIKFATNRIPDCQTTYLWNFGDGNTSLARAPIHVYSATGTYNVTVSITSNCASCSGSVDLSTEVSYTVPTTPVKDTTIQVLSEQKLKVINHSVSTFSDAWPLPHENASLSEQNGFVNGSDGVWRNNGVFVYQAPRTASETVNIRTDGTYTLQTFNWKHAELQAIPNWTKANAITRYSPYSYELENQDVLGVYSAAVYDHFGQLPVATGVNMRNEEMAFTSFESVSGQPEGPSTGNWTIGSQSIPEYKYHKINGAYGHMATVEAPLSKLQDVTVVDVGVYAVGQGEITNYQQNVGIVCMQQHPNTPNWTIVVLAVEPAAGVWTGMLRIKNVINTNGTPVLDNTHFHSGKRSLRINAQTTFKQELLKLEAGKRYFVSAWVSVGNPNVPTPTLAGSLGFDINIRQKTGELVSTEPFAPAGQVIEGWQQIRGSFEVPIDQPVIELVFNPGSLGTAWYDDLRLHPENGNMKSYVYNLLDYRLSAILDEENFASYFFYDAEGNLYLTKKETRDGVKTLTENITYQVER